MRLQSLATLLCASLTLISTTGTATEWKGVGELGLSVSRGNARAENLNAKLGFTRETEQWNLGFKLAALRAKGEVVVNGVESFEVNANRYEAETAAGYKFNDRQSLVGNVRAERDDFAAYRDQLTLAIGYRWQVLKSEATDLSFEGGPGYRRLRAQPQSLGTPPVEVQPDWESDLIVRGEMKYRHQLTETTTLTDTLLVESGDSNTFIRNDLGIAVAINASLALKAGLQHRHNTEAAPGQQKTDTLLTTNLVYNF
jgi:putative salt-induced outer membrane protein